VLNTGRALYQFNAGTMTARSRTAEFQRVDVVEISPVDADALGVADGEEVRVISRYGAVVLGVRISPRIARGELFATFQSPEFAVNWLTSRRRDNLVKTPEYKITAVRIERAAAGEGAEDSSPSRG
jgi:formate dehydrogenase major subunit